MTVSQTGSRFDILFTCLCKVTPKHHLFKLLKRKENSSPLLDSSVQTLVQNVAILVKTRVTSDPLSIGSGILTTFPFIQMQSRANSNCPFHKFSFNRFRIDSLFSHCGSKETLPSLQSKIFSIFNTLLQPRSALMNVSYEIAFNVTLSHSLRCLSTWIGLISLGVISIQKGPSCSLEHRPFSELIN